MTIRNLRNHLQKPKQGVNEKNVVPLQGGNESPESQAPDNLRNINLYGQQTTLHDARRQRHEGGRTQRHQEH